MYICIEQSKQINDKSERKNNALYYLSSLDNRRIYRQSYPLKPFSLMAKILIRVLNCLLIELGRKHRNYVITQTEYMEVIIKL